MNYKILVGSPLDSQERKTIEQTISSTFDEIHRTCDKWNPHSELSALNALPANVIVSISSLLQRLFQETQEVVDLTQQRFDPTIEPLQALWKDYLSQNQRPPKSVLDEIAPAIGWHHIHVDHNRFYKDHSQTKMDFGGIAKGMCIDLLIERLSALGYQSLYVEWGGEIRVLGHHPEGRPWTVYISKLNDVDPQHAIATLYLSDQAIATSGDYLQNWCLRCEGRTTIYHHIFSSDQLYPQQATFDSIASISVVAPTCALADGLATAMMLFPDIISAQLWAESLQEKHPELSFWILSRNANYD